MARPHYFLSHTGQHPSTMELDGGWLRLRGGLGPLIARRGAYIGHHVNMVRELGSGEAGFKRFPESLGPHPHRRNSNSTIPESNATRAVRMYKCLTICGNGVAVGSEIAKFG